MLRKFALIFQNSISSGTDLSFLLRVPEAEREEVDVIGLLAVHRPGLDGLRQELVDPVSRLVRG